MVSSLRKTYTVFSSEPVNPTTARTNWQEWLTLIGAYGLLYLFYCHEEQALALLWERLQFKLTVFTHR